MKKAFTLIELLIVVAIIAILAAIAVPNFLEAQVRSKVTRARADMRSCATALEAYSVDYSCYPTDGAYPAGMFDYWHLPPHLSTPIAYISNTNAMLDPFNQQEHLIYARTYRYLNLDCTWGTKYGRPTKSTYYTVLGNKYMGTWAMTSDGPDKLFGPAGANTSGPGYPAGFATSSWNPADGYPGWPIPYDPTNGTVSWGDIQRTQRNTASAGND